MRHQRRFSNILPLAWDPRVLFFKLGNMGLACLSILCGRRNIVVCFLDPHVQIGKNFLNPFDCRVQRFDFFVKLT